MSIELDHIIPWGRSGREYELMFGLAPLDLEHRILGCGDGPASFNADMARRSHVVISCDPLYVLSPVEIRRRFEASVEKVMSQVRRNSHNYVWKFHRSPEELLRTRRAALDAFLADYAHGRAAGRYVAGELPRLPFGEGQFDVALCSHLLFLYTKQLSLDFHINAVLELGRVASETRIFPLTDLECNVSAHVEPVTARLQELGWHVSIEKVDYQLQRNGDAMMRISRRSPY
jgi:hypothetical protein